MLAFTEKILNFLFYHQKNVRYDLTRIPSNGTALNVGDVLLFKYHGKGIKGHRMALVVEPVTKEARTGNELVSAVKIDLGTRLSPDQIDNLYNLRTELLPEKNYRTYILGKMEHIRRVEQTVIVAEGHSMKKTKTGGK